MTILQKAYGPGKVTTVPQPGLLDAFGRLRTSSEDTIFDSKMLQDNLPLFWDDQEISGTGTSSTYDTDRAGVTLAVGASTAGARMRRTFRRMNYQPGKSQLILMTGVPQLTGGGSGIISRMGYYDDSNGLIFAVDEGVPTFVLRSNVTGSPVDNEVVQSAWNVDKLDGTGPSGITLDVTKSQILFFDFEWLGVGNVRMGFVINGAFVTAHVFQNSNVLPSVYMSSPNLPLTYEIRNDGTGVASEIEQICSSVISEGGQSFRSQTFGVTTENIGIVGTADTPTAVLGLRLRSTHLDRDVFLNSGSFINQGNNPAFEWRLYFRATVAGTFTYSPVTNSGTEVAIGDAAGANTVSGGTVVAAGVVVGERRIAAVNATINSAIILGAAIDGTQDTWTLAVVPYGSASAIDASLNWGERA